MRLNDGWTLERRRDLSANGTGACNSVGYVAKHDNGAVGFVKVLDTRIDRYTPNPLDDLQLRIDAFQYERQILERCTKRNMSAIVRAIGFGEMGGNRSENPFYYLVFEMAERDLREHVDINQRFDLAYRMRVLHRAALGIQQLHSDQIAHQDLKPSNVLLFPQDIVKLGDVGHAHVRGAQRPGKIYAIAADPTYAPPEQLYGHTPADWGTRRFGADLYLLGSLIAFLFTGSGTTPLLANRIRAEHHWDVWTGPYHDVLPYVRDAMEQVIEALIASVDDSIRDDLTPLARYLCEPDPALRGHPVNRAGRGGRFGVERFVSRFDYCAKLSELTLRKVLAR